MRVLIAENQSKVRFALRVTLERQPGLTGVSEVLDPEELIAQAEVMCPDLILLDWDVPGMDSAEMLRTLRKACPHLFVIALGGKEEERQAALIAGADDFVCKADPPERLLSAIDKCRKRATSE